MRKVEGKEIYFFNVMFFVYFVLFYRWGNFSISYYCLMILYKVFEIFKIFVYSEKIFVLYVDCFFKKLIKFY